MMLAAALRATSGQLRTLPHLIYRRPHMPPETQTNDSTAYGSSRMDTAISCRERLKPSGEADSRLVAPALVAGTPRTRRS